MNDKVTIVILNWNGKQDTIRCLDSLKKITYNNHEIVVIDNDSNDGSIDAIKEQFPEIKTIANTENLGFTGGCNQGINHALQNNSDFVLLLNNDTIVAPDFLKKLVKTAKSYENVGIVSPKILDYFRPNKILSVGGKIGTNSGEISYIGRNELDNGQYNKVEEREFFEAACWLVPKPIFRKIGLFDDDFVIDCEDIDFCIRLRKRGFKIWYCPTSTIWHKENGSWGRVAMKSIRFYWVIRNRIKFMRKHATPVQKIIFFIYLTIIRSMPLIGCAIIKRKMGLLTSLFYGVLHHLTGREYYDLKNITPLCKK